MTDISASNVMAYSPMRVKDSFYEALEEPDRLKDLEDFLNGMGIICKLVLKKLPDGQREYAITLLAEISVIRLT